MATSGTVSQTVIQTAYLIEHGFRRAKSIAAMQTPEYLIAAERLLFFYLSSLADRGVMLWCLDQVNLGLRVGKRIYDMPVGTVDVQIANYRTYQRPEGTVSTSDGGIVEYAFDSDVATSCVQVASNGNVQCYFGSDTQITQFGYLADGAQTIQGVVETSPDALTWTTVLTVASTSLEDLEWKWLDINLPETQPYIRYRATNGTTIEAREVVFANLPNDVPMARMNINDYNNFTNKNFPGRPLQYWFNRVLPVPQMYLWNVPNNAMPYLQLVTSRQVQDVGTLTQSLEVPQRWWDAVMNRLAWDLARELPGVPPGTAQECKTDFYAAEALALAEERDKSPVFLTPNIGPYTR